MWLEFALAGLVAVLLTLFEIARTFYVPKVPQHRRVFLWWGGGFVLANGILAVLLYSGVRNLGPLQPLNGYVRAFLVGASYLILVRSKLATIKVGEQEVPLGLEYVYNAAKEFVYKGMNSRSVASLTEEAAQLAGRQSLKELASTVNAYITNHNLLTPQEKTARKAWLLKTLQDATTDDEKRLILATYILSERM